MKRVAMLLTAFVLLCGASARAQTSWSFAAEYSTKNPNGPWSYGTKADDGRFLPFVAEDGGDTRPFYLHRGSERRLSAMFGNKSSEPKTLFRMTIAPGEVLMLPGRGGTGVPLASGGNDVVVVRFTAPRTGLYAFNGDWRSHKVVAKSLTFGVDSSSSFALKGQFPQVVESARQGQGINIGFLQALKLEKGQWLEFSLGAPKGPNSPGFLTRLVVSEVSYLRAPGDGQCPAQTRLATASEVKGDPTACAALERWEVARLADGASLSGSGYKCELIERDTREFGHSVCVPTAARR